MRIVDWLLRRREDDDLQEEIRVHLSMAERDRTESGENAEGARLSALKEFGNVTLTRDATRRSWGGAWREHLIDIAQDVRYSFRVLLRSPGYAIIVIAVLALGLGANVAVFSLFKSLALKPLPGVDGSGSLGVLVGRTGAGRIVPLSHPDFRDLQSAQQAFAGLAGTTSSSFALGLGANSRRVQGELVTGNYFQVLGVGAQLGRTLQPSDDVAPGKHPVVVISDRLWKRTFDSDPAIVGKVIRVNATSLTVAGVAQSEFHGTIVSWVVDLFIPIMMQPQLQGQDALSKRQAPMLWGLGRLNAGISVRAADHEAELLSARLATLQPERQVDQRATVIPMWRSPYGAQTYMLPLVGMLSAMGALLLLLVCANISNLVLVRGVSRRGEIAARLALGAGRSRILRLLLTESLVLSLPGLALGLVGTRALLTAIDVGNLVQAIPITVTLDTSADWSVIVFAGILTIVSSLLFAFIPALRSSRMDIAGVMKDDLSPRGGSRGRLRGALVVSQVAMSLLLLVCASLILRSLTAAQTANAGFDPVNVAIVTIDLKPSGYDEAQGRTFYRKLLDTALAEPGVDSATLTRQLPLGFVDSGSGEFAIEGRTSRKGEDMQAFGNTVATDYFRTLRIPLISGRDFTRTDGQASLAVAIVNETMARRFWSSPAQAIGKRLRVPGNQWRTVVGVARDIKYFRLTEEPRPYVYLPLDQAYTPGMVLLVRGRDGSAGSVERSRALVGTLDPDLPTQGARMLSEVTQVALTMFDMGARVLMIFGAIALMLTALGTYGLVSYTVKQSTHEIGIRLAIGANRLDIVRRFLRSGLTLGAIGGICGLVAAVILTRLLVSLLYGVSATDMVSFLSALAAVSAIVVGGSLIPAWRGSRTDPASALRHR